MSVALESRNQEQQISVQEEEIGELLEKEWLLTNERGSYASGTVIGCNTRRYHGLLAASLHPPVERYVTLATILEKVSFAGESYELANFEFSDRLHPQGYRFLRSFRRDTGVHFDYQTGPLKVEKSLYLSYDEDVVIVTYDFSGIDGAVTVELTPLVAMRDFHSLQSSSAHLDVLRDNGVMTIKNMNPQGPGLSLYCAGAELERGPDWWYAMRYRQESRRGQHDYEDVLAPGMFRAQVSVPGRLSLVARVTRAIERPGPMTIPVEKLIERARARNRELIERAKAHDSDEVSLVKAADQFIVRRAIKPGQESASILAGYHWFADWGRDTFISLPGLLLETGRYNEAKEVLETFGAVLDQGMICNRFDDYGAPPHYNSVDSSLWYINAAYLYYLKTKDDAGFYGRFRALIADILTHYENGTRDIKADADGLITAGNPQTQLTWMDAKCNGVVFTPRYGKAVEINALWYNGLSIIAETAQDKKERARYEAKAKNVAKQFKALFWNEENQCLNDCILPEGRVDAAVRPNQIFAVSLPFSCLLKKQQKAVVEVVERDLLTPYGLRSLSPRDSRYAAHYDGDQFQRDSAYHQGTVWAYLMGAYIEAFLKVHNYTAKAKKQAGERLEPLLHHLHDDGCLGSISEIFDGDYPHRPKGCVAQAWSVAEVFRAKRLLQ